MYILLALLIASFNVHAEVSLKVLNFNTMCDFCKGSNFFTFDNRLNDLRKIFHKHDPDLASLQELRSIDHANSIVKDLEKYSVITSTYLLGSYADPTIIFKKSKFKLIDQGQFWLGPNEGNFSIGWKFALPRQVHWVRLKVIATEDEFYFVSTHLDNRIENLTGSAKMIHTFLKQIKFPILFAGDTNLTVDMDQYKTLTKDILINSFDIKKSFQVTGKYETDKDICYTRKGKVFPDCRVDHILLSKGHDWEVENFIIDTYKTSEKKFPSDHRPVIINLKLN